MEHNKKQTINEPFAMAAQTAPTCYDEIIRWCQISRAHRKTSLTTQKKRKEEDCSIFRQEKKSMRKAFCCPSFMKDTFTILCFVYMKYHSRVKASSLSRAQTASLLRNLCQVACNLQEYMRSCTLGFFGHKCLRFRAKGTKPR